MRAADVARIDTSPVTHVEAAAIESAEARAWSDMFAAAPPEFAREAGVGIRTVAGALVVSWRAAGRRYFNRPIGLGVVEPATEAALDDIAAGYEREGIEMFLVPSQPHCPAGFEDWLVARGFEPFDSQDRVVRDGRPFELVEPNDADARDIRVERVTAATADEWAEFMQRTYDLDTGRWLQALIGRPGWHQYVAREGGEVVAARGMHVTPELVAWVGMDGPVPGLWTDDFAPDVALWQRIVVDGLGAGARMFISDIEAPSPTHEGPAYEYLARLGFRTPYARTHWAGR